MYRVLPHLFLFVLLSTFACSAKKADESVSGAEPRSVGATNSSAAEALANTEGARDVGAAVAAALPPGPFSIVRTALDSRLTNTRDGQELRWQLLGDIEVLSEEFREVYKSRGKNYVSFKAQIRSAKNCLLDWRVELIEGKTGRGRSLEQVSGLVTTRSGELVTLSGVVAVSDESLPSLASASAGYWTLCGDVMPAPNAHSIKIESVTAKKLKFGAVPDIHHTGIIFSGRAPAKKRCYFELVAEDVDSQGFTLNRDFASFSVGSDKKTYSAMLRRTSFAGGSEKDYDKLVVGKRGYIRNLHCTGPVAVESVAAKDKGLQITGLSLHAHEGDAASAEHLARQSYGYSASLQNTMARDCSFRLRTRVLDKDGFALNHTSMLSEVVHLQKGASVNYRSKGERLFVWLDHVSEVSTLIVEEVAPIDDCNAFDLSKAIPKSLE